MNKFSNDEYLKKRIKEIYRGRHCNLVVMNGELFQRDSNGRLTQIFVDADKYWDKIQEKFLKEEELKDRKKIIAVKKAALRVAIGVGSALALAAWFSVASHIGKKGEKNRKERFDSSMSQSYDYTERGR